MRKNGFTLIELLAVIVILAIIALIATPIILGIINDAREESNERSVELYASAVRNAVAAYQLTNSNAPTSFGDLNIQYDGEVVCSTQELYEDGSFYLEGCTVNGGEKEYSYGTKQGTEKACTLDDKDGNGVASLSDMITCGTESFYVMYNENNEITMFSKFNLDLENNIQSETNYVPLSFSVNNYWFDIENSIFLVDSNYESEGRKRAYVYGDYKDTNGNQQNLLYPYVKAYEDKLINELKVESAQATLMSYEQAYDLMKNDGNPNWLSSTLYWTGSSYDGWSIAIVYSNMIECTSQCTYIIDETDLVGIRPVITMPTSNIK